MIKKNHPKPQRKVKKDHKKKAILIERQNKRKANQQKTKKT